MGEVNGFEIAIRVLSEKIAQLESEVSIERYYKEDYKKSYDVLMEDYRALERKYNVMIDKLSKYCDGGIKDGNSNSDYREERER